MFGRKDSPEDTTQELSPIAARAIAAAEPIQRNLTPTPTSTPAARGRNLEMQQHNVTRRNERNTESGERKLTVGKGLSLSGEISACDVLVVEGKVEAKLTDGKMLEITESGQFRGSVEIENADIAGRYDGELTVHGRLTVRGSGRISGLVKYGELEVNAGGQIIGELAAVGSAAAQATPHGNGHHFKNAAKFTSMADDDEATSRKAIAG